MKKLVSSPQVAEALKKLSAMPAIDTGLTEAINRMRTLDAGLTEAITKMKAMPAFDAGLTEAITKMKAMPAFDAGLTEAIKKMIEMPAFDAGVGEAIKKMKAMPAIDAGFAARLEQIATQHSIARKLSDLAATPRIAEQLDRLSAARPTPTDGAVGQSAADPPLPSPAALLLLVALGLILHAAFAKGAEGAAWMAGELRADALLLDQLYQSLIEHAAAVRAIVDMIALLQTVQFVRVLGRLARDRSIEDP